MTGYSYRPCRLYLVRLEGRDIARRRIDEPRPDAAERRDHVVEVGLVVPAIVSIAIASIAVASMAVVGMPCMRSMAEVAS